MTYATDHGISPLKGLSPAERAVKYILDVLLRYPELAWYLGPGTEMLRQLCEAEAHRLGVAPEQFEEDYCMQLAPANPTDGYICPDCGYMDSSGWVCRVCGCTDERACPGGCCWVEKNLCSACAEKTRQQEKKL
jgi:hypothetical protein